MTTTTKTMSAGGLAGLERTITAEPKRGAGRALLSTIGFVMRQLAGSLAVIALVWLVVMLFRHVQVVAFVLLALVLVLGGAALFVRNRSLSR